MRGHIRKITAADGSIRYECMYRESSGRQRSKRFDTERAAAGFLSSTVTEITAGTYRHVTAIKMADVFARWDETLLADLVLGTLKRSTYRSYRSILRHHLIPAFGAYPSDAITDAVIVAWRNVQAAKIAAGTLAPKTFNNMIGVLNVVLEWARTGPGGHAIGQNPIPRKRFRAKVPPAEIPIIQGAEIARLWAATRGQDRVIVALALFAGLRRGEIFGLDWGNVMWPQGRQAAGLHVSHAFVQRQRVTPKSAAGRRTVDLPARIVRLLRIHELERPPIRREDGIAYLIRQDTGAPIDPDTWATDRWPQIQRAAKLPAGVTLHALRHTFGSLHLANGAHYKYVSEQMGHGSPAFTMAVYQKTLRATSATARRRLDRFVPELPRPSLRLVNLSKGTR